jgi:hypothetical protein
MELCRWLKRVDSIRVNSVVEMTEIATLKNGGRLGAEEVKVNVSEGVNEYICYEITQN